MSNDIVLIVAIGVGTLLGMLVLFGAVLARCYRTVGLDKALVRSGLDGIQVTPGRDGGLWVIPILHHVDVMDVTLKHLMIQLNDRLGLICRDGTRVDCKADFHLRIGEDPRDIRKVAEAYGCQRATNLEALHELFDFKFTAALRCSASMFDAKGCPPR